MYSPGHASAKFVPNDAFNALALLGKCVHLIIQPFQEHTQNKAGK